MDKVETILAPYADLRLECDGLTRVFDFLLAREKVEHQVWVGNLRVNKLARNFIPLHFWIELGDGRLVDYRARMWLGDCAEVPHGVFLPSGFPLARYDGRRADLHVTEMVFKVLCVHGKRRDEPWNSLSTQSDSASPASARPCR